MSLASSLKPCVLLLFLYLLSVCAINSQPDRVLFGRNFPALYVFGDSLVDSGNNNHLGTQAKSNHKPFGSDFHTSQNESKRTDCGIATGRTGNGKTIADYIAIYYGLPLAPAYLGLSEEERNNISTGINYASASCGVFPDSGSAAGHCLSMPVQVALFRKTKEKNLKKIFKTEAELNKHYCFTIYYGLPLAPAYLGLSEEERNNIATGINYASASCGVFPDSGKKAGHCLSMPVQVALFRKTKEKNLKKIFKTEAELNKHLAESLFMIAIGVNDYNFQFNETTDPNDFANKLLLAFATQIQRLHWLGAKKFFINNLKPVGCYPDRIAKTVPRGTCDDTLNHAVSIYNAKLNASLPRMMQKFSGTSFLYSDYFNFMLGLRGPSTNHESSDLVNSITPCCPNNYDGKMFCERGSSSCEVPDTHIFFDPFHPTQLANYMYAIACFHERRICHVVRG